MITINAEYIEDLVIWKHFEDAGYTDLTFHQIAEKKLGLLGLDVDDWKEDKGKWTELMFRLNGVDCARVVFSYVMDGNKVVSYTKKIEWFLIDGTVGLSKDVNVKTSLTYLIELNQSIWKEQIKYLRAKGEELRGVAQTLPEPYKSKYIQVANSVELLWVHYKDSIKTHEDIGGDEFVNAVNNEPEEITNPDINVGGMIVNPIYEILNIDLNGLTVKQTILNEIS